jgi:putative phosphoesterase
VILLTGGAAGGPQRLDTGRVRLVITADTHLPNRARELPEQLWHAIDRADLVIHAGDWVGVDLLDELTARSAMLLGVYGNNDGPPLRARLPEVAWLTVGGLRLAVVHETGPAGGRQARCAARFPGVDLLVFGHSHIPWDSVAPNGMRLLNPGSPTDRRAQPTATYLTAGIEQGELVDVQLHRLPVRPGRTSTR